MLYLSDQSPSAVRRLRDIRYHCISAGFQLFRCAATVTISAAITSFRLASLIFVGILGLSGSGGERRQFQAPVTICEISDLVLDVIATIIFV